MAAAAREEADTNLSGFYTSSEVEGSNITISTSSSLPGLGVVSWFSNHTNMLLSPAVRPSIRLYPTGLERTLGNGDREVGFRAVLEDPRVERPGGAFSPGCISWAGMDLVTYGSVGSDEFLFVLGEDGKAKKVVPRVLRVELERGG